MVMKSSVSESNKVTEGKRRSFVDVGGCVLGMTTGEGIGDEAVFGGDQIGEGLLDPKSVG